MTDLRRADTALGVAIVAQERARWSFSNDTEILTLADGRRVVRQAGWGGDLGRRVALAEEVRRRAARVGILMPEVLAIEGAPVPVVVMTLLPGRPGAEALAATPDGHAAAAAMGHVLVRLRKVDLAGLDLDATWAQPAPLATASRQRLEGLARGLGSASQTALRGAIDRLDVRGETGSPTAVLAHGDFAPVNVLLEGSEVTGLIDLSTIRMAEPSLDVAWWGWVVWFHHRELWPGLWPAFLRGAGWPAPGNPPAWGDLLDIALLRMLELAAEATSDEGRQRWTSRMDETVDWDPDPDSLQPFRAAS